MSNYSYVLDYNKTEKSINNKPEIPFHTMTSRTSFIKLILESVNGDPSLSESIWVDQNWLDLTRFGKSV